MGNILDTLPKDKPLYSLTVGEFQALLSALIPAAAEVIQTPAELSKFVDINGAALILGRSANALRILLSSGKLQSVKKGGNRNFFERDYLDRWMKGETEETIKNKKPLQS